jgi:hypothetical protein
MNGLRRNDVDQVSVLKEDRPPSYNSGQNAPALSGQMAPIQAAVEQLLRDGAPLALLKLDHAWRRIAGYLKITGINAREMSSFHEAPAISPLVGSAVRASFGGCRKSCGTASPYDADRVWPPNAFASHGGRTVFTVGCVCVGVGRHGGGRHYGELRTMTRTKIRDEIEKMLERMVERGHARVVGITEGGKKRYSMTEEGLFTGEPNVEFALLIKGRRVIMALKHPTEAPAVGEDAALNILLCDPEAEPRREDAVEIWNFVLPFDQRDIDFGEYTCEGFDPTEIEFACRSAGLWRDWEATFEKVVVSENLEASQVATARVFLDRFGGSR